MNDPYELAFAEFPVLETERLILRRIRMDDAEALFRVCSDHEWLRLWGFPVHRTVDDTRAMIAMLDRSYQERAQLRWGITLRGKDEVLGALGFYRIMRQHYRAEVTYEQNRAASGNGYMTEALRAIVRYGFDKLDLHSIEAGIDPEHRGSLRVADRCGFQREGYLKQNYFFQGKFYDTVLCTAFNERPAVRPY
ncbi:MAG: GNAT family N-acetyltransferase [Polyangiaceae bacterium]|nr:GNAT family N-acetyltransferase [Polyangiaceae bacterium]